ncbi:MAG: hypothetical protein JWQ19_516 [Subtercola sp.]|nr:hypothetical protein [Subtercola sp.]
MSVFTDVAAEGVLLAGGGRAILLQIADAAVGAGVARHSDFANRPLDRFANTVTYAYAAAFGTPDQLHAVVDRVNRAHGPVHSPRSRPAATAEARVGGYVSSTAAAPSIPFTTAPGRSIPSPTASGRSILSTTAPARSTPPTAPPTTSTTSPGEPPSATDGPEAADATDARGGAGEGATAYDAFDPAKQLWVAATLYQSAITVYEKVFGTLDAADAEDVFQQYAVLGTALQVPPGLWPPTLAEFNLYWADAVSTLVVSDDARRVASDLLHPRTAPLWLRVVMPTVRLVTAGLLTPELRRAFVLPWNARRQRRFDRLFALTSAIYPHLPIRLRHLPRDRYMSRLANSLA